MHRKTKIVATVGPSISSHEAIEKLITLGVNVFRLNMSHGDHDFHSTNIRLIREAEARLGLPVAIMIDLSGPKIRVGRIKNDRMVIKEGQSVTINIDDIEGHEGLIPITYRFLPEDVEPGDRILLADGAIELVVEKVEGKLIHCRSKNSGVLSSHKGLNVPTKPLGIPSLTDKDKIDVKFAVEHDVDWLALSFVRKREDVLDLRRLLDGFHSDIKIVAKIEKAEAVRNIDSILEVTDGVMVARGDLGVEIELERVPIVQKMVIRKALVLGKPSIVATQMLLSMVDNPRPTRAEVNDVANAVFEHADAVMLSEETAVGKYPYETVRTMDRILRCAESEYYKMMRNLAISRPENSTLADAISHAACIMAADLNASCIVTPTHSGFTARMVSRFRPAQPIVSLSPDMKVVRQLCLVHNVYPMKVEQAESTDEMFSMASELLAESGFVRPGDTVIITAGVPINMPGTTNLIKVQKIS